VPQIESMVRSVCETVLRDASSSAELRHKRAQGLLRLGELYHSAAKPLLAHLKQQAKSETGLHGPHNAAPPKSPLEELRDIHSQLL
jgi:hypothetical protein